MNAIPTCWIIADPNGAGKTTFALRYLPALANCRRFINADLIAAGLSPLEPDQQLMAASRIFLPLTSQTRCFMNNGTAPELVFQQAGLVRSVSNAKLFELLSQKAQS